MSPILEKILHDTGLQKEDKLAASILTSNPRPASAKDYGSSYFCSQY
jgi:hypothetical protein